VQQRARPSHYRSAVDGFEIRRTNPACGKVAFTGERIIVEDVTTDPLWEPAPLLSSSTFRACWSFPIRSVAADKILGTNAIYYDSPHQPRQEHIDAVELLTQTAALITERHKAAEERAAAHERLRRSESRLRLALAGARAAAWEWGAVTGDIEWSPAMFAMTGLASETGAHGLETYLKMIQGLLITSTNSHDCRMAGARRATRPSFWLRSFLSCSAQESGNRCASPGTSVVRRLRGAGAVCARLMFQSRCAISFAAAVRGCRV
jgi:PAS domain-containing protein